MPTYDYECRRCGHRFERLHGMRDAPAVECPECGGDAKRLIGTGAGVIVRGEGGGTTRGRRTSCERERPCCGRETRCDRPPCAD